MKNILVAILIVMCTALLASKDAYAQKRLGGGKSFGMQRQTVKPAPAPAPTQNSTVPAKPAAPVATPVPPTPAPSGASRWLGPLAGLAAGGLLASLFMGGGFGGIKMFDILLIAGMGLVAFMIFRAMSRKPAMAGAGTGELPTGTAAEPTPAAPSPERVLAPEIGSKLSGGTASVEEVEAATHAPSIPAGFEVEPFLRQGRVAFIRLQAANDRGDTNDIREFTTPEMYAELAMQIQERGNTPQRTEVTNLDVRLLEVAVEGSREVASVRFSGQIREAVSAQMESFDEVWHVTKNNAEPESTWMLAGIQQLS